MHNLLRKSLALARSRRDLGERVRIKLDGSLDRLSVRCRLSDIARADQLDLLLPGLLRTGTSEPMRFDEELKCLESAIAFRRQSLDPANAPFGLAHNGTKTLGRICYAACRALRPQVVVETGVAYGITSAYILRALAVNNDGTLLSIDLPPLAQKAEAFVGYFVAPELRHRWDLRVGSARKLLPGVLKANSPIGLFVHDSLHTYRHMKWEFESAFAALRPGGVLVSDDIEGNTAFEEAIRDPRVDAWLAINQEHKAAVAGVIRKR